MNGVKPKSVYNVIMRYIRNNSASKSEYFQLFLVCLFPIQAWALVNLFYSFPSMQLEMTVWQMLSVTAYVFAFALFETLVVFLVLFLLSLMIPRQLFSARLVATGTALVLCASIATILNHLNYLWNIGNGYKSYWSPGWIAAGIVSAGLMIWGAWRSPRMEKILRSGAERVALLSILYLTFDVIGVLIVISRNI